MTQFTKESANPSVLAMTVRNSPLRKTKPKNNLCQFANCKQQDKCLEKSPGTWEKNQRNLLPSQNNGQYCHQFFKILSESLSNELF